ncbi:MAG: YdeI/OmpD-associated family protein [Cellulomonas sp.]
MAPALSELVVADPVALRKWLAEHHATSPGVVLVLGKAGGSITTVTWESAVEELLCVGWIDGMTGKRDHETYTIRVTPRRPKSTWSARNVALVTELEAAGRMLPAGRAAVSLAKADGRWDRAYAGPADAEAPGDLAAAIAADPAAQAMWEVLTRTNRFTFIYRVTTVKLAATRTRKITETVTMLARGETPYPQRARPEPR